jgi:murein lipoprotein
MLRAGAALSADVVGYRCPMGGRPRLEPGAKPTTTGNFIKTTTGDGASGGGSKRPAEQPAAIRVRWYSGERLLVGASCIRHPSGAQMRRTGMFLTKQSLITARTLAVAVVATMGLGACATYDDEFATINSRLDQLDQRVASAAQSAESANQSAQRANQRLDQMESQIQQLETRPARSPRG